MPVALSLPAPGEEDYTAAFMRPDGIQLSVSARDFDGVEVLHVSLAPVYSLLPNVGDAEKSWLQERLAAETPAILQEFFGGRQFTRQPDDPRPGRGDSKHYFSPLT